MDLPVPFPLKPMLAKASDGIPTGEWMFEPKWDGFRCIVFRDGDEIELGSRNQRPLTRYFPDLLEPLRAALPRRCVVDGEIVVVVGDRLDFDALGQRIHPAESRVGRLSIETPADFVAFDLLAVDETALLEVPFHQRRRLLEVALTPGAHVHLTPMTTDRREAERWFQRVEGAGLDGLIAKQPDETYQPDKRVLRKVKHQRSADCVAAGFRWHKDGEGIGSIILGIYDGEGLRHVGVASSFTAAKRAELADELAPSAIDPGSPTFAEHPWAGWVDPDAHVEGQMPGAPSRWNNARDQSWIPLPIDRVVEVGYTIMTNGRFRGTTRFLRWRPDKTPAECTYDQLEEALPLTFAEVTSGKFQ